MYFLIACKEEPPRSLRLLMALPTISDVLGWAGLLRGFLEAAAFAFFGEAWAGAEAGAEAADAVAASAMVEVRMNGERSGPNHTL